MAKNETKSSGNIVSLNIDEVKNRLTHIIENNRFLQKQGKIPIATAIDGISGLGKTSTIIQLANELGLGFYKLNLSQIEELGDLVGYPIRQFEVCKEVEVEGKHIKECHWIDEPAIESFRTMGYNFTGNNRMGYCPPFWIAGRESGGILLLDDWTRADLRFVQAVMELIDRQTYISWKLPKDWHIVLTSNPDNGEYFVQSIDSAQRTRFLSFNLKFDKDIWATWAEKEKIDGRCINFLLRHPEIINEKKGINARSTTNFFNSISSMSTFSDANSLALITDLGHASVGEEFTTLFTTFIHKKLDRLPSPEEIFDPSKKHEQVIKEIEAVVKPPKNAGEDQYRADIASILCTRMINHSLVKVGEGKIDKIFNQRLIEIVKSKVFTNDLGYHMAKTIYNQDTSKFAHMILDPQLVKVIIK